MKKLKFSRLLVLFLAIAIPIFITYNFWVYDFKLNWLPISWQESKFILALVQYVTPILFCIAWIYFFWVLATLIADSIDLMNKESSFISVHYLFFFGVNTLVLFYIFLIPLITPVVAILAYSSMIFKGLTSRVSYDDLDEGTRTSVRIITFWAAIPAIFCSILIIPESLQISLEIWNDFWLNYVDDLFFFIKALGVALSIGATVLIYKRGVQETEHGKKVEKIKATPGLILSEFLIVLFILFLNYQNIEFVEVLYYLSPIFSGFTFVINIVKGRKSMEGDYGNPLGIAVWFAFMITILLFRRYEFLRIWSIIISAILFTIYFIAFLNHPTHEKKSN